MINVRPKKNLISPAFYTKRISNGKIKSSDTYAHTFSFTPKVMDPTQTTVCHEY